MGFDINSLTLPNYQSADLATVDPNPAVPNSNNSSILSDFGQISDIASQWGLTIASIVQGNNQTTRPNGTGIVRAPANPNVTLLLLAAAIVVVVLVLKK